MTIIHTISRLIKDPPPEHAFEISEAGISYASGPQTGFQAFEPGTIAVSPSTDNILRPEKVSFMIGQIAPANGAKKRRRAALILPDYAARCPNAACNAVADRCISADRKYTKQIVDASHAIATSQPELVADLIQEAALATRRTGITASPLQATTSVIGHTESELT